MPALQARVRFGNFELDPRAGELHQNGRKTRLHEQQLQILLILIAHNGEIATREEIRHKLWPNDTVVEFDHSINNSIKKLRQALGDSVQNPNYIETIASRGYRLLTSVQWIGAKSSLPRETSSAAELCSQSDLPPRTKMSVGRLTGKIVSHYRVLELIGGGGMGLVYRAEDVRLGRSVALKFLPEEVGDDPKALKRFEREARAASALQHPNICTLYEFGEHQGQPFIAMELLKGEPLRERLTFLAASKQHLPLNQFLDIAIQTCDALHAAHHLGIIHRDIKPANIFLTTAGCAKILDFGLAKLTTPEAETITTQLVLRSDGVSRGDVTGSTDGSTCTRTGTAVGSEGYMSPEQIRGERLDARTDLFSFGLVLYEMATGQRAFSGTTSPMVRHAILTEPPSPLRELNPALPAKLVSTIEKALEKDIDRRWQSAAEMLAELRRLQTSSTSKTENWRSLLIALIALLILVIAALLTIRLG